MQNSATRPRLIVGGDELAIGPLTARCAVGRGGVRLDKHEGDGATPQGVFPLRQLLFRPDRLAPVDTGLPVRPLTRSDGWCDDVGDPRYNELVTLPYAGHHEELWRDDHVYDVIVVIGYNDAPVVAGRGSAIFLHIASPDYAATDGCVAVAQPALLDIVRRCDAGTLIEIRPS